MTDQNLENVQIIAKIYVQMFLIILNLSILILDLYSMA